MFSPDRILTIRKSRGLSQEMLAEHSGVSLRTIQRVEQGETVPRGHTLQALAAALGVSLDDFRTMPAPAPEPVPEAAPPTSTVAIAEAAAAPAPAVPTIPALMPPATELATRPAPTPAHPAAPGPAPAQRADPQFLQLLNLSALAFLVLPLLNIVLPLLLWRARRHDTAHVAEVGRRVLGFQILWQAASTVTYLLLVLVHWLAARFFHAVLPGTFIGVFVVSYVLNVLAVGRAALQLRRGELDIYRVRL